jgi:hypothetical protein
MAWNLIVEKKFPIEFCLLKELFGFHFRGKRKKKENIITIEIFFLISQCIISKAQRGATLSTLGVYKRD